MPNNRKPLGFSIDFSNPVTIYATIWLSAVYLYSLEFTNNILGMNDSFRILISGTIISFVFIFFGIYIIQINSKKYKLNITRSLKNNTPEQITRFKHVLRIILKFWITATLLEVVLFGGVPLTTAVIFGNYDLDYKAFGIPTLHGLLNACYYTIVAGFFLHYRLTKNKASLWKMLILLTWPLLVMSRAMLLWALVEILCMYFLLNRINFKKVLFIIVFFIGFIVLFGILGDSRADKDVNRFSTDNFINEKYTVVGEALPTGFVWVYLYITTPINNIVLNIDNLDPKYDFKYSLAALFPSLIRDRLFSESDKFAVELENEAFNGSSFFANYLHDFGVWGTVAFVAVLEFISVCLFFSAKSGKIGGAIAYSAFFYALMTSVAFDNFISLVTIFQIFLGLFINSYIYRKPQKKYVQG
ncbi:MAG: hypothetical protein JWQ30_1344 [Sediminibacterium sp.]|nr:hypothetical protein [Sediminibacterium sp.]